MMSCLLALCSAEIDYVFEVGKDNEYVSTKDFGCFGAGCGISKTWQLKGTCKNAKISASFIETDFLDTATEKAFVFIDGVQLGQCANLNQDGNYVFVGCTNINQTDISNYINSSVTNQTITVHINSTIGVNCCEYTINSDSYQLYARITIECDGTLKYKSK